MAVNKTVLFLLMMLYPLALESKKAVMPRACDPCLNGGTLQEEAGDKFSCQCKRGWKGNRCQRCENALGMEDGAISDGQITASSYISNHAGPRGRLNFQEAPGKIGSWTASTRNANQWLQVDLGTQHPNVSGVATQGGTDNKDRARWVRRYKLQHSDDGVNFQYYREQGQTTDKEFVGNKDGDTVEYHDLKPSISARFIRFQPTAWRKMPSMRVELYGCKVKGCDSSPCLNGGTCTNEAGGKYSCQCKSGWKGDSCEDLMAMGLEDSAIVGKNAQHLGNLTEWLKPVAQSGHHWELCWRASRDGWAASQFHSLCDGKEPTVTIIRVDKKYIFGGYTALSWMRQGSNCVYHYDSNAFLFSLENKPGWAPVKLTQTGVRSSYRAHSMFSCSSNGPTFGGGSDIYLADQAASNTISFTNLGYTYSAPSGHRFAGDFTRTFLAGSYNFSPDEVETFYQTT